MIADTESSAKKRLMSSARCSGVQAFCQNDSSANCPIFTLKPDFSNEANHRSSLLGKGFIEDDGLTIQIVSPLFNRRGFRVSMLRFGSYEKFDLLGCLSFLKQEYRKTGKLQIFIEHFHKTHVPVGYCPANIRTKIGKNATASENTGRVFFNFRITIYVCVILFIVFDEMVPFFFRNGKE